MLTFILGVVGGVIVTVIGGYIWLVKNFKPWQ
jgi:hypothetical protein